MGRNIVRPTTKAVEEEDTSWQSESTRDDQTIVQDEFSPMSPIKSVKFCIIFLMSGVVLASVVFLSAIWIGSLLPTNIYWSSLERDSEFNDLINSVKKILLDVTHGMDAVRGQARFMLDFEDLSQIEKITYQAYKTEQRAYSGLVVTTYFGKNTGTCLGTYYDGEHVTIWNSTLENQLLYYCDPDENYEICQRSDIPDLVQDVYDISAIMDTCKENPSQMVFTPSYVDITTPNLDTFITLVYCYTLRQNYSTDEPNFDYFLAYDLTVASASDFLIDKIKAISGARSFIVDLKDNFLVAIDNREAKVASEDSNGDVQRETVETIKDEGINGIYSNLKSNLNHNVESNAKCDSLETFQFDSSYVSIYRLCLSTKIDWLFVLSIPQWNYEGSVVIGILSSIFGAIVIIVISISLSICTSVKIVKPFNNLIEQFDLVACMDLDNITIKPSSFSEVRTLQRQFLEMTNTIKMYRAFLPPHLLEQFDRGDKTIKLEKEPTRKNMLKSQSTMGLIKEQFSSLSGRNVKQQINPLRNSGKSFDMFSLFLERKRVTIALLVMDGFSTLYGNVLALNETIDMITDLFDQLSSICRVHGGLVGNFDNDSLIISFNSTNTSVKHQEKAVSAAKQIIEKLTEIKRQKWSQRSFIKKRGEECRSYVEMVNFRIAICSQECVCGNVGTKTAKNYTLISNSRRNLEEMMRKSIEYDLKLVVSQEIHQTIQKEYHSRYVGTVKFIDDFEYSSIIKGLNESSFKMEMIYEIGESTEGLSDGKFNRVNCLSINFHEFIDYISKQFLCVEWMYELNDQEKKQRWNKYNQACTLMFNSEYQQAVQLFLEFYKEEFDHYQIKDIMTTHQINHCQSQL